MATSVRKPEQQGIQWLFDFPGRKCSGDNIYQCRHLGQLSHLNGLRWRYIQSLQSSPPKWHCSTPSSHFQRRGLGVRQCSWSSQYQKTQGSWVLNWSLRHGWWSCLWLCSCLCSRDRTFYLCPWKFCQHLPLRNWAGTTQHVPYSQRARNLPTLEAMHEPNSSYGDWGSRGLPVILMVLREPWPQVRDKTVRFHSLQTHQTSPFIYSVTGGREVHVGPQTRKYTFINAVWDTVIKLSFKLTFNPNWNQG